MTKRSTLAFTVAMLALLLVGGLLFTMPRAEHAQAAIVTPSPNNPVNQRAPYVVTLFDGISTNGVIASDTRSTCFDVAGYGLADVQWEIDQGAVNTVTLTLQHAVDTGIDYETLTTLATDNETDADGLIQSDLWGRYLCAYAAVANTETVTITVKALIH